ncbi:hypothetical protein [Burkholderia ambifaria]|uniref:hypothetical protein n=1 Tax=Burkholderia ambifaria TaxID=152480 RepID=UPI001589E5A4|nr:hypothetical protein [Burkholderia ambifaria]
MSSGGENQTDIEDKKDAKNMPETAEGNDFKRLYANYVSAIPVVKDTLDVLWKLAPIGLIFPAILIWSYLKKIGWQQLFPEAVISLPGLVVMIVASCLLMVLLAIQFSIPSIISVFAVGVYEEQSKIVEVEKIRKPLAILFIVVPAVWLMSYGVLQGYSSFSDGVSFALSVAVMVVLEVYVICSNWVAFSNPGNSGVFGVFVQFVKMALVPTVAGLSVLISLAFCLSLFSSSDLSGWAGFFVYLGCAFYSVIGVIPGAAFLIERIYEKKPFDIFKTTIFMGALVFYVIWMGAVTLAPITSTILRSIGAIDERRYVYQIIKSDLTMALQGAGFKVHMVSNSAYSKGQSTYFVDAYVRFNFANVMLLCRDPFAFNKADRTSMTNDDVQERSLVWRMGGNFCVKARADEVRLLQTLRKN